MDIDALQCYTSSFEFISLWYYVTFVMKTTDILALLCGLKELTLLRLVWVEGELFLEIQMLGGGCIRLTYLPL